MLNPDITEGNNYQPRNSAVNDGILPPEIPAENTRNPEINTITIEGLNCVRRQFRHAIAC